MSRNSITYIVLPSILITLNVLALGQSKNFLTNIDTFLTPDLKYFKLYDAESFFDEGLADEQMDPTNINNDLLNATVFFMTNRIRIKKKREPLKFSEELYAIAYNYLKLKSARKFENNKNNKDKYLNELPNVADIFNFKGNLTSLNIENINAVKYKKNKVFYYDKNDCNPKSGLMMKIKSQFKKPCNDNRKNGNNTP